MSQTNLVANTYNPHNQSPEELISGFVVRKKEFDALYGTITDDRMKHPPQHMIIQGRRGSGKTSFLLRIFYEIKHDPSLTGEMDAYRFTHEDAVSTLIFERTTAGRLYGVANGTGNRLPVIIWKTPQPYP